MPSKQSARSVLMISPTTFGYDYQTAESNAFMVEVPVEPDLITHQASDEFEVAVEKLRAADVDVIVHQGDPDEYRPSAVFPNNWLSTWPDGRVFTYPMATASRRVERDSRVLDQLTETHIITEIVDISESEVNGQHLESTGAIVFDHQAKVAYGCISERCDVDLFTSHVESLGYRPVAFHAYDPSGVPIYHTNVMLAIQSTTAVICSEAIPDPAERQQVLDLLRADHTVIDIGFDQLNSFCGNVLEIENRHGDKLLVMSQTAYQAFDEPQRQQLAQDKKILPISIPTIEVSGGGSIRCMLAEIFLPTLD